MSYGRFLILAWFVIWCILYLIFTSGCVAKYPQVAVSPVIGCPTFMWFYQNGTYQEDHDRREIPGMAAHCKKLYGHKACISRVFKTETHSYQVLCKSNKE
jgi:hypothetical protein